MTAERQCKNHRLHQAAIPSRAHNNTPNTKGVEHQSTNAQGADAGGRARRGEGGGGDREKETGRPVKTRLRSSVRFSIRFHRCTNYVPQASVGTRFRFLSFCRRPALLLLLPSVGSGRVVDLHDSTRFVSFGFASIFSGGFAANNNASTQLSAKHQAPHDHNRYSTCLTTISRPHHPGLGQTLLLYFLSASPHLPRLNPDASCATTAAVAAAAAAAAAVAAAPPPDPDPINPPAWLLPPLLPSPSPADTPIAAVRFPCGLGLYEGGGSILAAPPAPLPPAPLPYGAGICGNENKKK